MTAGWGYYSWPGNSGPAASVGLVILWVGGCGIEFEELMGHSGKKSVGSWLSYVQKRSGLQYRFENQGHEMFRACV